MTDSKADWKELGAVDPRSLVAARLACHWGAQVPGAFGNTLVPKAEDWSHVSLAWREDIGALVTQPSAKGLRAGLCLGSLSLVLCDGADIQDEFGLAGETLENALSWLAEAVGGPLTRPDHELPAHPAQAGEPFATEDYTALLELERWYANTIPLLETLRTENPGAGAVRCWPHHFDVATLITLDPDRDPETGRSIGVGISPGDGSYAEPYLYVTPWPKPEAEELPALTAGKWHTAGWTGAVVTGTELVAADDQASTARGFFTEAARSARALIG